ncbi:uncharacterized [Tachysurus ichikawai]
MIASPSLHPFGGPVNHLLHLGCVISIRYHCLSLRFNPLFVQLCNVNLSEDTRAPGEFLHQISLLFPPESCSRCHFCVCLDHVPLKESVFDRRCSARFSVLEALRYEAGTLSWLSALARKPTGSSVSVCIRRHALTLLLCPCGSVSLTASHLLW